MPENKTRSIGDFVLCEWDKGKITSHRITNKKNGLSQSGVMYQVDPPVRLSGSTAWIDSDWFYDAPD